MARFFVVHRVETIPESYEEWVERLRAVRARACGSEEIRAAWLNSWYVPSKARMYCEWEAERSEDIHQCLTDEDLLFIPVESIMEVAHIDASWLDD